MRRELEPNMKMMAFLLFFAFGTSLFAQSDADLQQQRIEMVAGTWIGSAFNGITLVFNADGTCSGQYKGTFVIGKDRLAIYTGGGTLVLRYHFSSDGKTLFITDAQALNLINVPRVPIRLEKQ